MDTGRHKYLQSRNRSPLSSEGPSSTGKKIRLSNNLSGEFSLNDIDNVLSPIHCDRTETNTPNVCSAKQAYTQSNELTPSSSSFSCVTDVHGYALLTPPNSHDIPESFTSVRTDKYLTVRPHILNQLRMNIYGQTTTSSKTLYSRNMDDDYKIVSRFNKINRRFTLSMRRHLKSHPFDYFMYHEDPRGYRIKVPLSVEECMPLAEKRIKQLLDKYTLNEIRVVSEEPSHVDMLKEIRKRAMKKIHEKKDIIARRNSGILAIAYEDMGDPTYACGFCGALMWFDERLKKSSLSSPEFGLCCSRGKIQLPLLKQPPRLLRNLLQNRHIKSRNYIDNIRAYNMMYAFTSMGGIQDKTVNNGHGPYTYRLGGNNYHLLGSLLPKEGDSPKFSQLYMYCGEDETQDRIDVVRSKSPATIDPSIVDGLKSMIDAENPIAQNFRMAAERFKESSDMNVKLCLMGRRSRDGRMYNLPTCSEVAALIVGNDEYEMDPRDIVLERKNGDFQRISELHPSYLPMQYPLLFPYGEDGYHPEISHSDKSEGARHTLTIKEFLAFRIFDRNEEAQTILLSRKLFQQFIVDGYMMMEAQRLAFIMRNQPLLRSDKYKSLDDAIRTGDIDPAEPIGNIGKRFVLPSSFVGGPRYMVQNFQDTMAICKSIGYPELFITFTCNPKWPEITRFVESKGLRPEDRPDVLSRIFKLKLDQLIKDLKTESIFGKAIGVVYTIEFQKRGLPHAHILLWIDRADRNMSANSIDDFISAEIPSKKLNPELYNAVSEYMVHGPCGPLNPASPCMHDGKKCSKKFPKSFNERTMFDGNGYPVYRRRDTGDTVDKNGNLIDNSSVQSFPIDEVSGTYQR
ncbi:hypothetical protein OROMI_021001 [Orobanche minor]